MKLIGNYKIIKEINSGTSTKTYLAEDTQKNNQKTQQKNNIVVLKQSSIDNQLNGKKLNVESTVLKIIKGKFDKWKQLDKETQLQLSHLLEIVDDQFIEQNDQYLVLKHYENSINFQEYLKSNHKYISHRDLQIYFHQILSGLKFLHQNQIYHRDLNFKNILFCQQEDKLILLDYGCAVIKVNEENETCGTMIFNSPQAVLNRIYSPEKNDIWQMGIILYYLFHHKYPFCDINEGREELQKQMTKFMNDQLIIKIDDNIPQKVNFLLKKILIRNEKERPSIFELYRELNDDLFDKNIIIQGKQKFKLPKQNESVEKRQKAKYKLSLKDYGLGELSIEKIKIDANTESVQSPSSLFGEDQTQYTNNFNNSVQNFNSSKQSLFLQENIMKDQDINNPNYQNSLQNFAQNNNNILDLNKDNSIKNNNILNLQYSTQTAEVYSMDKQESTYKDPALQEQSQNNIQSKDEVQRKVYNFSQHQNTPQTNKQPIIKQAVIKSIDDKDKNQLDISQSSSQSKLWSEISSMYDTQQEEIDPNSYNKKLCNSANKFFDNIQEIDICFQFENQKDPYSPIIKQLLFLQFYLSKLTHFIFQTISEFYLLSKYRNRFYEYTSNFLLQKIHKAQNESLPMNKVDSLKKCKYLKESINKSKINLMQYENSKSLFMESKYQTNLDIISQTFNPSDRSNYLQMTPQNNINKKIISQSEKTNADIQSTSFQIDDQSQSVFQNKSNNKFFNRYLQHADDSYKMSNRYDFIKFIYQFKLIMNYISKKQTLLKFEKQKDIENIIEDIDKRVKILFPLIESSNISFSSINNSRKSM